MKNPQICAPAKSPIENKGKNKKWVTCYSRDSLVEIAKSCNESRICKIPVNKQTIEQLWNNIKEALKDHCESERCWATLPFVKKLNNPEIERKTFRPPMPEEWKNDMHTWLTTIDIFEVMRQYEDLYKDFMFFGPVPMDFDKIRNSVSQISLSHIIRSQKNKLGIVFNLDNHDQDGSHWVALFVNLSKPTVYENRKYDGYIFYYDSYGIEATEEINILANRLIQQASNLSKPLNLVYVQNDVRHQYGGSECGVYCMHFILRNLKGKSINFIKEKRISDSEMNKFRKYFFVSNK